MLKYNFELNWNICDIKIVFSLNQQNKTFRQKNKYSIRVNKYLKSNYTKLINFVKHFLIWSNFLYFQQYLFSKVKSDTHTHC